MAPRHARTEPGPQGIRQSGADAFRLTTDYLKQETLGPLKGLGRFVAWGLAGSLAMAVGFLLLLVGVLRLLQTETGSTFGGDLSWVPYFVVSALGLVVAGLAAWRITAGPGRAKLPQVRPATSSSLETPEGSS